MCENNFPKGFVRYHGIKIIISKDIQQVLEFFFSLDTGQHHDIKIRVVSAIKTTFVDSNNTLTTKQAILSKRSFLKKNI